MSNFAKNKLRLLLTVLNQIKVMICLFTPQGEFVYTNKAAADILEYSQEEILDLNIWDIVSAYDKKKQPALWKKVKENEVLEAELWLESKTGKKYFLNASYHYIEYGEEEYQLFFVNNISEEKKLETEYKKLINGMNDTVWVIDLEGRIIEANNSAVELLGYTQEELKNMPLDNIDCQTSKNDILFLIKNLPEEKKQVFESVHLSREGEKIPVEISSSLITYKGELAVLSIARDIRRRKENEAKIKYMTFHDQLTGLYNRHYLEEEIQRINTKRQLPISVIIADLNNLKKVNDNYGHQKGDQLLQKAAELIKTSCRDEEIIARMGGDEFIILLPQTSQAAAEIIKERIINNFKNHKLEEEIPLSIALGIASKNKESESFEAIITKAEEGMYINKLQSKSDQGRNILASIMENLQEKSDESSCHIEGVQKYSLMLAEKLELSKAEIDKLKMAAHYHDIGKIIIPEKTYNKAEKLSAKDWEKIKMHPDLGAKIISWTEMYEDLGEAIKYHHEKWDGSGYPAGIAGDNIPLFPRIISIADAFEVMISGRVYKKKMSLIEAVKELQRCAGTQFDPELVEIFIEIIKEKQ
ncbi:diguanylate cyclase domain-containing protein [Halanaerobium hydrogeniformans]|uniref:Diguanylate cyclase and metal dependent phosphohydrolase n=1 Tax=Halanaerobium hydrogeniformans TaxID=656519 RepID=E4RNE7_HALHG|nr:HD domain-containing phosphohydrolase [Halanaerobium hydrogeniformans]ADQ13615.1 diguanylate cyclase and metal dependent phosphohydrolase [Halanaerobium hydrogeniformans]